MTSKIPPLLSSYVQCPPPGSLTLLTSVLSASTNWLILRYLYACLNDQGRNKDGSRISASDDADAASGPRKGNDLRVILVSWLRDWDFWKSEARRAVGLNLVKLQRQERFAFVDGLSNLFSLAADSEDTALNAPTSRITPLNRSDAHPPTNAPQTAKPYTLSNPSLKHLTSTILTAISSLTPNSDTSSPTICLILDMPSLLLHSTTPPITSTDLSNALLSLRSHVHATVVALPADGPLIAPAASLVSSGAYDTPPSPNGATPLEVENAAFVVGMAHQAYSVLNCRMLGTGFADDVSGVLRATRGGCADDFEDGSDEGGEGRGGESGPAVEEGEWLYFVGGDGSVRVWRRGAGGFDVG